MPTVAQVAEQVMLDVASESSNSRYDIEEFILKAGQARDYAIVAAYFQSVSAGEKEIPAEVLVTYESVEVKTDSARKKDYLTLPAHPLRLPNNMGVYAIAPMEDEFNEFFQQKAGDSSLLTNQPVLNELDACFWVEGIRAYFTKSIKTATPTVLVKLIPSSTDVDGTENLWIPADLVPIVVEQIKKSLGIKPQQDKATDNIDKP